jgi:hypothetical protein
MADPLQFPACFDPYLRYAIASDFTNFESFDARSFRVFLLVEFKSLAAAKAFRKAIDKPEYAVEFSPVERDSYTTMRAHKNAVTDAATDKDTFGIWNDNVSRVELSLPLKPADPRSLVRKIRKRAGEQPPEYLIGILDDGCPFAAAHFLSAGGDGTRVRGIWDQNNGRMPIPLGSDEFGRIVDDFNYGIEFLRETISGSPSIIGLNDWIQAHRTTAGSIDEDNCYADAGFKTLKRQRSHGGHVMDLLAGRVPISSRIGPFPPRDRRDPPSWQPGADRAAATDVVFVQFSEDCIRDATGVWLKSYVLDGIDYILSFADPTITKGVFINVSYGPTIGPHDGTAALESALKDLVGTYDGSAGKLPKLEILLPVGNSYLSEGHVQFKRTTTRDYVEWTWRIPPDNSVLVFAEVWMEKNEAGPVIVTLTSPNGRSSTSSTGPAPPPLNDPLPPYTGVYSPLDWGDDTVWLLAVQPTIATSGVVLEHGNWTVRVDNIGVDATVHAYVARSDPNMDVRSGARRSYFVDPEWERTRSAEARCKYVNGKFDKAGSLVRRDGTLSGIATGQDASVHVAGGYIIATGRKSPYASAGPARGGPRVGPEYALPCDESYALRGIRAGGNRTGSVFRLIGTSVAAPQLARLVTNSSAPRVIDPTHPPEETGYGDIAPP